MTLSRRSVFIGVFLAIGVSFGLFWLYAAQKLGDFLHQPLAGGQTLADLCESSDIGGFPFRLKLGCRHLVAPIRIGGKNLFIGMDEARGAASVMAPGHVVLTLSSPILLRDDKGEDFGSLRHDGLTLDLSFDRKGLAAARLDGAAVDWRPDLPQAGIALHSAQLTAEASRAEDGVGFSTQARDVVAPALQNLLNDRNPGQFALTGVLAPAPDPALAGAAALDDWRDRKGALRLDSLNWQSGAFALNITGALALDDQHRLTGKLNLSTQGGGPLLAALGVPSGALQAGNLLDALLGAPKNPNPNGLDLTVTLVNGRVAVGPLRLPLRLDPLY